MASAAVCCIAFPDSAHAQEVNYATCKALLAARGEMNNERAFCAGFVRGVDLMTDTTPVSGTADSIPKVQIVTAEGGSETQGMVIPADEAANGDLYSLSIEGADGDQLIPSRTPNFMALDRRLDDAALQRIQNQAAQELSAIEE